LFFIKHLKLIPIWHLLTVKYSDGVRYGKVKNTQCFKYKFSYDRIVSRLDLSSVANIKGSLTKGTVIFENEDNATYELVDFYYEDEQRVENILCSGSLRDVIEFSSFLKQTR